MRLIRSVRRSVSKAVLLSLVTLLVLSRVGYGNATLAGLPARQLCRLQSVLHAAARIVFSAPKYDHVTPLLRELLWVPERITFKLASLVCHIIITVDFQTTFEDVCDLVLMALLTLFLSVSTEHVVFFVCYVSLQFLD